MGLRNMTEEQKAAAREKGRLAKLPKDPKLAVLSQGMLMSGVKRQEIDTCLASVPALYRNLALSAFTGEITAHGERKLKCLECCGFEDVQNMVGRCTVWKCAHWLNRPYQGSES